MSFTQDHARITALEWFVEKLVVEHCMKQSNPAVAVAELKAQAESHGQLLIEMTAQRDDDSLSVAVDIASSLGMLADEFENAVRIAVEEGG